MSAINDPIADLLTRIRNAIMAGHQQLSVPASKIKIKITEILHQEGYLNAFEVTEDNKQGQIEISLKYLRRDENAISGLKRVSKPGRRVYCGSKEIPSIRNGLGVSILSTSQGVMDDKEARKLGVGGEILCYVW